MIPQCQPVGTGPALTVWWLNMAVKGSAHPGLREFFQLWSYNPTTNVYTGPEGLAAGRAAVVAGPTTVFSIQGTPCLQGGSDGSVQAAALSEYGGPMGNGVPQLQFFMGSTCVATVSVGQLRVRGIVEGTPVAGNLFQIFANGSLAGTIAGNGVLLATEVEEAVL